MANTRILLLGMENTWSGDPKHILAPVKPGCTGSRLLSILHVSEQDYMDWFIRDNVVRHDLGCNHIGSVTANKAVLRHAPLQDLWVVALGNEVGDALMAPKEWCQWRSYDSVFKNHRLARIPHPSGVNHYYNEAGNTKFVRRFLLKAVKEARGEKAT